MPFLQLLLGENQQGRQIQLLRTNCLSVFDHFVGLSLKGLRISNCSEAPSTGFLLCKQVKHDIGSTLEIGLNLIDR